MNRRRYRLPLEPTTGVPRDAAYGGDGGREGTAAGRPRVGHAGPLRDPFAVAVPLEVGWREGQRSQHPRGDRQLGRPVPAGAGLPQGGGQRRQVIYENANGI